eukprot:TRINITY_DN33711_c0_g1_i1.p1 TRINITY_DN33711_c0_g1~~TRINITY_DN33711_c0_g1_i1.p1  ORF type:complete len:338 (-),score=54.11 TRINITY_DN33711_c0_g1_i1:120-1052(-)
MAMMDVIPLDATTKNMVLALMNAEYPDAVRLYARHYAGKKTATAATLTNVDATHLSLRYTMTTGEQSDVTLPYTDAAGSPVTVITIGDCRRALVGMAKVASEALGEHIRLPQPRATDLPGNGPGSIAGGGAPPEEVRQLIEQMQQLRAQGGGTEDRQDIAATTESSGIFGGGIIRGAAGSTATSVELFKGEGSKLGSEKAAVAGACALSSSATVQANTDVAQLREVDPEMPVVRLRIQLLDRRPAKVMVNRDFTLHELRAWLEHHQGDSCKAGYHLMDVGGFPPKKLSDMKATMEELGLTGASSLACRPA